MGRVLCNNPSENERWLFCHRNRAGGRQLLPNHSFYAYAKRFLQQDPADPGSFEAAHPEYFAVGRESSGIHRQLCYSSPELTAQVIKPGLPGRAQGLRDEIVDEPRGLLGQRADREPVLGWL